MNYKELHNLYNIKSTYICHKINGQNTINMGGDLTSNGYDILYDKYFSEYRDKYIKLAEIGILKGDSLYIHSNYFSNIKIYGYDIDISVFKNIYRDKEFMDKIVEIKEIDSTNKNHTYDINHTFDIIIDDACHEPTSIIATFENFYTKLNKNGLYCIEDVTQNRFEPIKTFLNNKKIIFSYEKTNTSYGIIFIKK